MRSANPRRHTRWLFLLILAAFCIGLGRKGYCSEVLVIGDIRFKPVVEVVTGIKEVIGEPVSVYAPAEVKGRLRSLVRRHKARTVIALGGTSIKEALTLPEPITVLYALVIIPPEYKRPNTAGFYMATPVREYINLIDIYLPELDRISVIATSRILAALDNGNYPRVDAYIVDNTYDFVNTIKNLDTADALLLLPDVSLLTKTAIEESYLFSFRRKVPLLGISKKHVRQGALFALEFSPLSTGQRLGRMAAASMGGLRFTQNKSWPPQQYELYINRETAERMNITIPQEMLDRAAEVYP